MRAGGEELPVVPRVPVRTRSQALKYGWLSRLRSYLIIDPLIWLYTVIMGLIAIPAGMADRDGRRLHWFSTPGRG